ncbi:peptidoglycan-binding protein [Allomesorhizobium camelthorni]|uniref:Peptidoglycan-binding protein n=1 Tax=Allomesorhizobium camelthorni TaxID=475069 RepID=A0A6G4WD60_9HYPH|nr:peptidoglycan-binding protein [Mesorhizobium camelthorni]NGO52133.1 peptidoglycan-binding protein [Mesorhizobium camelthorni]
MNSKRSYLDTLNAGRQRRPHTTLEQLNRSLETLEQRLGRSPERTDDYAARGETDRTSPHARLETNMPYSSRMREQPYQSIARDMDRLRGQEDGIAAAGKIAGELKTLREELRLQVTSGIRREFETLRKDIERAYSSGAATRVGEELGREFERIATAIQTLSERSDDKSINMLRLELEQVKAALDTLAREETVLSVDRRWDEFDRRWSDFEDRADARQRAGEPGLAALTARLEQISDAVNNLPESLSLRSLEEKVRTLAGAVDHFARQQEHGGSETFALIEERLDEISRAIVASTAAAQMPNFDPEPFERIEARISALARQIDEVAEDRPAGEVIERINFLSQRVDELAAHTNVPSQAVERLAKQIAIIADKIDRVPTPPDADYIFQGIEQRFDLLSSMIERRQGDALEQGNMLFRDLERRLDEVADRLDQRVPDATFDNAAIMNAIDARFAALADKIAAGGAGEPGSDAIRGLEARLESISSRLDSSSAQFAGIDPELIRSLEAQVSGLSNHLTRPGTPLPEFEDIGPRLDDIEKSIAGSRESILEAARQAAENAVRSLDGSQTHTAAVTGLAQDLKALEALTRRSDERNTKTFEAIHDTLIKIVDRLGSLENSDDAPAAPKPAPQRKLSLQDAPSLDFDDAMPLHAAEDVAPAGRGQRTPAEAAAAAAEAALGSDSIAESEPSGRRSMLGGIARALTGRKDKETLPLAGSAPAAAASEAPSVDLDEPLDPKFANRPLEPGSGGPDLNAIMKRVRDERGQPPKPNEPDAAKSDFIAAARRAAQAAAAEAEVLKRNADLGGPVRALRIGDLLKKRRKTILMASAGIIIALAGLQLGKAFLADGGEIAEISTVPLVAQQQIETASTQESAQDDAGPQAALEETAPEAELQNVAPDEQDAMRKVDEEPRSDAPEPWEDTQAAEISPEVPATQAGGVRPVQPALEKEISAAASPTEPQPQMDLVSTASASPSPATPAVTVPVEAGPVALREAADAGDAKALFEIASRYADGRGVTADMKEAAKWYEKSAELGFAPAQYRIGNLYEKGVGVERDVQKSKTWYQLAAAQGNASAMHNLAVLFAMGADGTADNESAARWFTDAAELGVKDSQFNLGILAAKGVGMTQNLEESYKWFALVAKAGDRDASAKRDEIANALRPEQLERARAAAELWKAKPLDPQANAVDIPESWQESTDTTAGIDMKKAVQNIQSILNKNGYDAGGADGVMGEKTKNAIIAFQKDNELAPTGEIDEKLVRALIARK